MVQATRSERRVRVGHLQRVDRLRAERDRADRLQRRRDPQLVRDRNDVARADLDDQLREDRVHRVRGRAEQVHVPGALVGEVVDVPRALRPRADAVGDHELGRPVEARVQRDAFPDGGRQHEWLERAAGRARALRREIELHLPPVGDVRHHRAHRAGAGIDRDHRRSRVVAVSEDTANRRQGVVLHAGIERRAHLQAAGGDPARAEPLHELLDGPAEIVRLVDSAVETPAAEPERRRHSLRVLARRDRLVDEHRAEHLVASRDRDRGVLERVVHRRRLRQAREHRRLRQCQPGRARREEGLCACLRSERVAPVEDLVQVRAEDTPLRPHARKLHREARLLQLSRERSLRAADIEVAHELLRDRRAALDDLPGLDVCVERSRDPLVVEAPVLPEAAILDRDRRLRQPG